LAKGKFRFVLHGSCLGVKVDLENPPEKIIVRSPNWVGDVVMATPTFRAIRTHFDGSSITLLAREAAAQLLEGSPWFDEVIIFRRSKGLARIPLVLRLAGQIRSRKFDLGILLTGSFSSALIFHLGRVTRRVGYPGHFRKMLLTDAVPDGKPGNARIPTRELFLGLARFLGCRITSVTMELFNPPEWQARAEELLRSSGVKPGRPLVALVPGSSYGPAKRWPPEYFAALAERLRGEVGAEVILIVAPSELPLAEEISALLKHTIAPFHRNEMSLPLIKAVIARAHLVISNDTGPRHIAAAFKRPLITIFGSSDPSLTRIDFDGEIQIRKELDCSPCGKRICPKKDHRCMRELLPEEVFRAARTQLEKYSSGGG